MTALRAGPVRAAERLAPALVMLLVAGLLHAATRIVGAPPVWDEPVMRPVIDAILRDGWTVRTLIDYEDTKGPVFFWLYAGAAELVGGDLARLRLVSVAIFILAGALVGEVMIRYGLRGGRLLLGAGLYAMLPYNALLGQLFMSEPSFLMGSAALYGVFLWSFGRSAERERRIAGPVLCGILLSLLLHHRPHAAAFAAAIAVVTLHRDGLRCWPWWLACLLAGLSRVPLYLRWDGLVSPTYQFASGLGFRLDSLTYLAAALLPYTAVFLWLAWRGGAAQRWARSWVAAAAAAGAALGLLFPPDLAAVTPEQDIPIYLGLVATLLRPLEASAILFAAALAGAGAIALASMAALVISVWTRREDHADAVAGRLAAITVIAGWGLYAFTAGCVFDRYLLPYAVLLPVVWVARLPAWLAVVQLIGLGGMAAIQIVRWLA
jgi:hypothetical protein